MIWAMEDFLQIWVLGYSRQILCDKNILDVRRLMDIGKLPIGNKSKSDYIDIFRTYVEIFMGFGLIVFPHITPYRQTNYITKHAGACICFLLQCQPGASHQHHVYLHVCSSFLLNRYKVAQSILLACKSPQRQRRLQPTISKHMEHVYIKKYTGNI